jgi:hypothetical protein
MLDCCEKSAIIADYCKYLFLLIIFNWSEGRILLGLRVARACLILPDETFRGP